MGHGGGGKLGNELVEHLFLPAFRNPALENLGDAAVLDLAAGRLAMSTDSFVVQPLFFPGGSIGELAVNGTVNDLAVSGAEPKFLSASFILEEGFPLAQLAAIVDAMAKAAATAGVKIVTGDTKVVERGHGDGCYINTAGVGVLRAGITVGPHRAQPGDAVLVSGTIGDHGMAIMSVREGLEFESQIRSDCAALNGMIAEVLDAAGDCGARHARSHARRSGFDAERDCAGFGRGHRDRRDQPAGAARGAVGLRTARARPGLCGQRGQGGVLCRAGGCGAACLKCCARIRWAATPRASAR